MRWLLPGGLLLLLLVLLLVPAPEQPAAPAAAVQAECRYLVREWEGKVAIFLPRQLYGPKYVTGIPVEALPQADREALEAGIPIRSDEQLMQLLEDYGS